MAVVALVAAKSTTDINRVHAEPYRTTDRIARPANNGLPAGSDYVEGYTTRLSYAPGDLIEFHVSTTASTYSIDILRVGWTNELVVTFEDLQGAYFPKPEEAWRGAHWPVTFSWSTPVSLGTGSYYARFRTPDGTSARHPLTVRSSVPGRQSRIAFVMNYNTRNAYNRWGGKSLYTSLLPDDTHRAHEVSFQRPFAATDIYNYWGQWEVPSHLESSGFPLEYLTEWDIHCNPSLVMNYDVLVFSKHHEYISRPIYDAIEAVRAWGGHLAFFSANDLWWQIRYEDDGNIMVGYQYHAEAEDPLFGIDNDLVTTLWGSALLNRPGEALKGVRYEGQSYEFQPEEYRVQLASHWAFAGTGLNDGGIFGELVARQETDYMTQRSPPIMDILLSATRETPRAGHSPVPDLVQAAAVYYEDGPAYGAVDGRGGQMFSAGSEIGWCEALGPEKRDREIVGQVTSNIISHMRAAPPWRDCNGDGVADHEQTLTKVGLADPGVIRLQNLALLVECLNGPHRTSEMIGCAKACQEMFGVDVDADVDLADLALLLVRAPD